MILVIAEKPSVAQTIAAALGAKKKQDGYIEGNGYLISWCVGHLVQLADAAAYGEQYKKWSYDSLPILPQKWQYTVSADKGKQFKILKELMHRTDISEVVNACDAGREGELIFRFVYEVAGCKKPMRRLWISSMEESAIKAGFENLKDGRDYDALFASALCRAKADWIIGINATRLFSCLYNRTLNVGRVQTPTLKMLVDRDAAISTFKKEKYYHVRLDLSGAEAASGKICAAEEAKELKAACEASRAVCTSLVREKKSSAPPKLFDLTSLQREANRIFGYTAKQTLDLAQSLYEKRLLTYPRTDSSFLTDDMGGTAAGIIALLCEKLPFMAGADFTPEVVKVLDSKKVSDHHAIIPTAELKNTTSGTLGRNEDKILYLVSRRLLAATLPPYVYEETKIQAECAGVMFQTKGKTVLDEGWKCVELPGDQEGSEQKSGEKSDTVPAVKEGQYFPVQECNKKMLYTSPPKQYSEDTLLGAMEAAGKADFDKNTEKKGIGTPATRAGIIEKLITCGYVMRRGKQLLPTQDGTMLIQVLPEYLKSPSMTAEWENELLEMEQGKVPVQRFMDGITLLTQKIIEECSKIPEEEKEKFLNRIQIGICPACGSAVYEGKKSYYCSNNSTVAL